MIVIYLSNHCPTRSVPGKTPQQAWSIKNPIVSHLHVFGSIAYAHVLDQERSKIDDESLIVKLLELVSKTPNF